MGNFFKKLWDFFQPLGEPSRSGLDQGDPEDLPARPEQIDPCKELDRIIRSFRRAANESHEAVTLRINESAVAVAQLEKWWNGQAPALPRFEQLRREYIQELWRLMGELRRRQRYEEALSVWALLRATTDETNVEVTLLAMEVAREFPQRQSLRQGGLDAVMRSFLVVIESLRVTLRGTPPEFHKCLTGMFDMLRVDWGKPAQSQALATSLRLIETLRPLVQYLPNDLADSLTLWEAVGRWRAEASPNYESLQGTFADLLRRRGGSVGHRGVLCWCKTRLAYESRNGDATQAVLNELQDWRAAGVPLSPQDTPETLKSFFDALTEVEVRLQRRASGSLIPYQSSAMQLHDVLTAQIPEVVRRIAELQQHVQPILEGAKRLVQQPRPSKLERPQAASGRATRTGPRTK